MMLPQRLIHPVAGLALFLLLLGGSCAPAPTARTLTFRVDISEIRDEIEDIATLGIIGRPPLLDRFERTLLSATEDPNIYEITLAIPDSLVGRTMPYRYRVDRSRVDNERYGYRRVSFSDGTTVLPVDHFDDRVGSTGDRIEPSLPIPVLRANTPQEAEMLAEPYFGVTTDGKRREGLFPIRATGVSTAPIQAAATAFLAGLTPEQRQRSTFPIEDEEWRKWHNIEIYDRQGVSLEEMDDPQRALAFGLLAASLSPRGVEKSKNIMAMEGYLKELSIRVGHPKEVTDRLGDDKYYFTLFGEPGATEPWGWQLDGHHLVINYFVLGDQVVMTPTFMGSEPNYIADGPNAGLRTFVAEAEQGLAFYRSLDDAQRARATLWEGKIYSFTQAPAFRDNVILPYAGIRYGELTEPQQAMLLDLIEEYVGNMRGEFAALKMQEVRLHLADTWFSWVGGAGDEDPFYYRIQSPVILIEFDHHAPVFLDQEEHAPVPWHVHTIVRTPNGNDYGRDLLRQHLERHHQE